MIKILLIIFILFLVGCTARAETPQVNLTINECDNEEEITQAIQSLNDFYGKNQLGEIDIVSANRKADITICPKGCTYYLKCRTWSMSPVFTCNDKLSGYKPTKEEIKIGDIIGFKKPNNFEDDIFFVLHRVIDIDANNSFITKGDNNDFFDEEKIEYKNVLFKVSKIEYK